MAVPEPESNPGLVRDCAVLLSVRDTLGGKAWLGGWSGSVPIVEWEGVTVSGAPARVQELSLRRKRLNGEIPSELAGLANLEALWLGGNQLTGRYRRS